MISKLSKILILNLICLSAYAQTFNPLLSSMLQDTLASYASQISNIKGISASVYIPGQGIWKGTYGDSYAGTPITSDLEFGIASNTKLFVATAILKLAENNILSLDDSLHEWLPTYSNVNPNITIQQLLNHTSGLSDPIFVSPLVDSIMAHPTQVFTTVQVLSYLGAPLFAPGTGWSYSNVNYILAGMIAQSATGFSIAQIIRDSILTPLNLDSTFYDIVEPEVGILAHRWWNNVDFHDTSRIALNTAGGPAGAIFSTASEMVQWYAALFNGQILNQNSLTSLTNFVATSNPNYDYGLGIARETTLGLTYFTHGGDTWGYKSKMMHDTCLGTNVCVLSNSFPSGMNAVTFLLYRVVKNHVPGCSEAISGANTVCAGASNILYEVPPIPNASSYIWNLPSGITGSSNTNSILLDFAPNATSGNISVTAINAFGQGGSASYFINVIPAPATPVISQNGNLLTSNALTGNQWYNSNGPMIGETGVNLTISQNDAYYCIVTQDGCNSDTSNIIDAIFTGEQDLLKKVHFSITPNPFSKATTINSSIELNNACVIIYNIQGLVVFQSNNLKGKSIVIERNALANGLYFLQLKVNDKTIDEQKIIISE